MNTQASAPTKLVAIPDRRTKKAFTLDPDTVPRATDKQVKDATAKAAASTGKTKHKPDAATIAAREAKTDKKPTQRQAKEATKLDNAKPNAAEKVAPPIPTTGYTGPMRALRDRTKAGLYVKGANGQPSCGDEVATILGQLQPVEVIKACLIAMNITNTYTHLNIGQQSMNLRNKLRGALKRGDFGSGVLREAVEEVIEARPAPAPEVK